MIPGSKIKEKGTEEGSKGNKGCVIDRVTTVGNGEFSGAFQDIL